MGLKKLDPKSGIVKAYDINVTSIVGEYKPQKLFARTDEEMVEISNIIDSGQVDFKISEEVSEHIGLAQLEAEKLQKVVEKESLKKLKEVEEVAYQKAYELGLEEGAIKAFDESNNLIKEKLSHLDEVFETLQYSLSYVVDKHEQAIMGLVHMIASKIAMFEIKSNQSGILDIIKDLIQEIQADERVRVKLSQSDYDFIQKIKRENNESYDYLQRVKLEPNKEITTGGCLLVTNFASINATVEQRVKKVWDLIEEKISSKESDLVTNEDIPVDFGQDNAEENVGYVEAVKEEMKVEPETLKATEEITDETSDETSAETSDVIDEPSDVSELENEDIDSITDTDTDTEVDSDDSDGDDD